MYMYKRVLYYGKLKFTALYIIMEFCINYNILYYTLLYYIVYSYIILYQSCTFIYSIISSNIYKRD